MNHADKVNKIWREGGASNRENIRRQWPALADSIDALAWRPEGENLPDHAQIENINRTEEALRNRPKRQPDEDCCLANHTISLWPYITRCVLAKNHQFIYDHIDKYGNSWRNQPCDGCKLIDRKREAIKGRDETAHYELVRLARQHRGECPNR